MERARALNDQFPSSPRTFGSLAEALVANGEIDEAAWCLQEGIIDAPTDGDVGAVMGIGFLPHYGGPFQMLDILGAQGYVYKMRTLADTYGERFAPCPLLVDHARAGKVFYPA